MVVYEISVLGMPTLSSFMHLDLGVHKCSRLSPSIIARYNDNVNINKIEYVSSLEPTEM